MSSKINIVLFGYGFLGKWHLEKVLTLCKEEQDLNFLGVVDPADASAKALKEKFPQLQCYKKWQDIKENFEAALIVTPTAYHFKLCQELIAKGCHIFCEKPITQTQAEAFELLKLTKANPKQIFQSGHSERLHEIWEKVRKDTELCSAPVINFKRVSPFKNRATDVDVISDLMIHDIDLLTYLTRETPLEVSAYGFRQKTEHYDYVKANFHLLSGQSISIEASRISNIIERSVEIFAKTKTVLIDLASLKYHEGKGEEILSSNYAKRDHLYLEQKAFFSSIREEKKPLVNAEEGYLAVKIVDAVRKSATLQMRVALQ